MARASTAVLPKKAGCNQPLRITAFCCFQHLLVIAAAFLTFAWSCLSCGFAACGNVEVIVLIPDCLNPYSATTDFVSLFAETQSRANLRVFDIFHP